VIPVSAVLIAKDEEESIAAALDSVTFCDEVLVVDGGSTDRTRAIAEQKGARVVEHTPWPGFVAQRNFAMETARHDWILALDADERVTPPLRDEIIAEGARGFQCAGYRIPRLSFYLGRWIRGTDWYPDLQLRLFDRSRGRWQGALIHESVRVTGKVGRCRRHMQHYPYVDISDHMRTIDVYTTLWARQAHAEGRRTNSVAMSLGAGWSFVRNYVVKGGFLLGEAGLTVSTLNSYYTYAKLAKLQELTRRGPRP
jgi:glycosyltransferase involved in cell wall biosynthesis